MKAGAAGDPPRKDGLASFTAGLLTRGTKSRTAVQLAQGDRGARRTDRGVGGARGRPGAGHGGDALPRRRAPAFSRRPDPPDVRAGRGGAAAAGDPRRPRAGAGGAPDAGAAGGGAAALRRRPLRTRGGRASRHGQAPDPRRYPGLPPQRLPARQCRAAAVRRPHVRARLRAGGDALRGLGEGTDGQARPSALRRAADPAPGDRDRRSARRSERRPSGASRPRAHRPAVGGRAARQRRLRRRVFVAAQPGGGG